MKFPSEFEGLEFLNAAECNSNGAKREPKKAGMTFFKRGYGKAKKLGQEYISVWDSL